jgi:hypothetical protein
LIHLCSDKDSILFVVSHFRLYRRTTNSFLISTFEVEIKRTCTKSVKANDSNSSQPSPRNGRPLTAEERLKLRSKQVAVVKGSSNDKGKASVTTSADEDHRFANLLSKNEDELLKFVAQVNEVFQEKLKKSAPFMTFVFYGMQSAGKSTIMERFLNAAINIVHEGTGTRCPLDTTCINDENCDVPSCDLSGEELISGGEKL